MFEEPPRISRGSLLAYMYKDIYMCMFLEMKILILHSSQIVMQIAFLDASRRQGFALHDDHGETDGS